MRVAVDARMVRASGIGVYLQRLLPGVIEAMPDASFSLLGDPSALEGFAGPRVRVEDYRLSYYSPKHHLALPKRASDVDLLWTPHFNLPAGWRKPQLTTIHDTIHLSRPEFFPSGFRHLVAKWWYRLAATRSQRLVTPSEFSRSEIVRHFPWTVEKLEVVPNFVGESFTGFQPEPLPVKGDFILTTGNIKPHKNVGRLLRAFESVQENLAADLVVVGESKGFLSGDPAVASALERSSSRIHFLGFVPTNLLKSLYAGAACTVFPSLYEGFGLGPLESMALGCPVVASDIPAHREVCGEAAAYFEPTSEQALGQTLCQLLSSSAEREAMREAGTARAAGFSESAAVEGTVALLRGLLN